MKSNNEIKIGIMVVFVLGLLGLLTFKTGKFNFSEKGYTINVQFKAIDGVGLNAPVMLNGLEVGTVKNILISYDQEDTRMDLTLWLKENAKLREGAKAYVKTMGFMGEKYVGLISGKGEKFLGPGALIVGQEPADLDKLLSDGQEIAGEIKQITQNINERLQKNKEAIDRIIANLDVTVKNTASITDNVDERLKVNKESIDDSIAKLHSASVNLDQLTYDLKLHPWKIMYRSKETREENVKSAASEPKSSGQNFK